MPERQPSKNFAEDISASLSRALEQLGDNLDIASRSAGKPFAKPSGKPTLKPPPAPKKPILAPPSANNMEQALDSPLNEVLGKADGGFLADLLNGEGTDDPANRDYGDRYEYLDILGEGGQGKVLRFRDTVLDRDVAIKVVKPPYTTDREKLLENEARLGGMLEHPNILPTYDLCRDETGSPFFVMKKVEGFSFDELLKKAHAHGPIHSGRDRGELSRRRLLNVFLQVCHAMQYAHSRGVCHLDLKPQNVKLGPFGEVYVLDWGFASRTEDNPKMVAGTPLYIAPERFHPGKPDQRCDIYSLGVMLYRILVNQLPRDVGKTSFKEFRRRIHDFPIVPPRQRDPSLPRDLEAIIMKAIAENPDDRYQTVNELSGDLERFLDILPVSAYREGLWGRTMKFARRHRATVAAGAVMLVAAALTLATSINARGLAAQTEAAELQARHAELQAQIERDKVRQAEEERRQAIEKQRKAENDRRLAEESRKELLRRRAAARVPMEKGMDIMDKSKMAVDKERDKTRKIQLLQPAIDFFTESLNILEKKGERDQEAAGAYYVRARAYEQAQEFDKAISDYRAAYQRDPSYIMAHYYLGLLRFELQRDEKKAMREFAAMNQIDPGNEFSEIGQAYIDAHTGRYSEALTKLDRIENKERAARGDGDPSAAASWRNPGLAMVWYIRGKVYGNRSSRDYDPEKSIAAYTNYLLYGNDKPSAYANRGIAHEQLYLELRSTDREKAERHLDNAIADYTQALSVDPTYKTAYQHRGYALFKYKKDTTAALRDIDAALRIDPNYSSVLLDRAAIHEEQQKYDLALKDYELVKRIQPNHPNIDYRLGILYMYVNQLAKAEEAFARSIVYAPNNNAKGIRLHRLGITKFLMGDFPGAVDAFDRSLEVRKTGQIYPALMRWLALRKMGKEPTHDELARMVDAGPDKPWLAVVASTYLGDDNLEGAQNAMRLSTSAEAVCETGFYLGARLWVLGRSDKEALYYLDKAVESKVYLFMEYSMAKILGERIRHRIQESEMLPDMVGVPPTIPSLDDLVHPD